MTVEEFVRAVRARVVEAKDAALQGSDSRYAEIYANALDDIFKLSLEVDY